MKKVIALEKVPMNIEIERNKIASEKGTTTTISRHPHLFEDLRGYINSVRSTMVLGPGCIQSNVGIISPFLSEIILTTKTNTDHYFMDRNMVFTQQDIKSFLKLLPIQTYKYVFEENAFPKELNWYTNNFCEEGFRDSSNNKLEKIKLTGIIQDFQIGIEHCIKEKLKFELIIGINSIDQCMEEIELNNPASLRPFMVNLLDLIDNKNGNGRLYLTNEYLSKNVKSLLSNICEEKELTLRIVPIPDYLPHRTSRGGEGVVTSTMIVSTQKLIVIEPIKEPTNQEDDWGLGSIHDTNSKSRKKGKKGKKGKKCK